ncbi:hypothetical protein [Ornithobacterium rhinotracheale]
MAKTDLNTIKQWFKNGLKPTQEQFWAWLDSFWHKDDKIPAEKVEGLDAMLSGIDLSSKVENTDFESFQSTNTEELNKKANANADNIADNVADWQTALSIYTKETAKKELGEKVDKEEGKGLSANDFTEELKNKLENFSNLSTADQTIGEGVERTLNVEGKLNITGLEDLEQDDVTYSKKLVINEDGTLAQKIDFTEPKIEINIPASVTIRNDYIASKPYESYSIEISQRIKDAIKNTDYEDVGDNFWRAESYNNLYSDSVELLNSGKGFKATRRSEWLSATVPDTDKFYYSVHTDYIISLSSRDFIIRMDIEERDATQSKNSRNQGSAFVIENKENLNPLAFSYNNWAAYSLYQDYAYYMDGRMSVYLIKVVGRLMLINYNRLIGTYAKREWDVPSNLEYRLALKTENITIKKTKIKYL